MLIILAINELQQTILSFGIENILALITKPLVLISEQLPELNSQLISNTPVAEVTAEAETSSWKKWAWYTAGAVALIAVSLTCLYVLGSYENGGTGTPPSPPGTEFIPDVTPEYNFITSEFISRFTAEPLNVPTEEYLSNFNADSLTSTVLNRVSEWCDPSTILTSLQWNPQAGYSYSEYTPELAGAVASYLELNLLSQHLAVASAEHLEELDMVFTIFISFSFYQVMTYSLCAELDLPIEDFVRSTLIAYECFARNPEFFLKLSEFHYNRPWDGFPPPMSYYVLERLPTYGSTHPTIILMLNFLLNEEPRLLEYDFLTNRLADALNDIQFSWSDTGKFVLSKYRFTA